MHLMAALDLIDLGLTPEVATSRVSQNSDKLIRCAWEVVLSFKSEEALAKAILKQRCPFGQTWMIVTSAGALSLGQEEANSGYMIAQSGPDFTKALTGDPAFAPAAAYIDFGSRLMLITHILSKKVSKKPLDVAGDLTSWAKHAAHFDEER